MPVVDNGYHQTIFKLSILIGLVVLYTVIVTAQELEPRSYSPSPVGANFLVVSSAHQWGEILFDPALPFEDVEASLNAGAVAYRVSR